MHDYGIRSYDERANEIKLFDDALATSCADIQAISIELIDKFFHQKTNAITNLNQSFQLMAKSTDNDIATHRTHIDVISVHFTTAVDNIWYALIELETSLHERIRDSMNIFNGTVRTIIENFTDKSGQTFDIIRSACDAYFQSNDASDEMAKERHTYIINQKRDAMCSRANKWLSEVTNGYELWALKNSCFVFAINRKKKKSNLMCVFFFISFVSTENDFQNRIQSK